MLDHHEQGKRLREHNGTHLAQPNHINACSKVIHKCGYYIALCTPHEISLLTPHGKPIASLNVKILSRIIKVVYLHNWHIKIKGHKFVDDVVP